MQLEQTLEMYQPMQTQRTQEKVYTIVNLESLSASALYIGSGPLGGSGPLRFSRGLGSVGSSNYFTVLKDPSPISDPLDKGFGIPISSSKIGYVSADGKPAGVLGGLNFEEISVLLKKYSKKY